MKVLTKNQEELLFMHFGQPLKIKHGIAEAILDDTEHLCRLGLMYIESGQYQKSDLLFSCDYTSISCPEQTLRQSLHQILRPDTYHPLKVILIGITIAGFDEIIPRRPHDIAVKWSHAYDDSYASKIAECCKIHDLSLAELPKWLTHDSDMYRAAAIARYSNLIEEVEK